MKIGCAASAEKWSPRPTQPCREIKGCFQIEVLAHTRRDRSAEFAMHEGVRLKRKRQAVAS